MLLLYHSPGHILLYVIGNVLIAANQVLSCPVDEVLYRTLLSGPNIDDGATPWVPNVKEGSQQQSTDQNQSESESELLIDDAHLEGGE